MFEEGLAHLPVDPVARQHRTQHLREISLRETGIEAAWTVGSLVICASILAHGVTVAPLTKLYGRYAQSKLSKSSDPEN